MSENKKERIDYIVKKVDTTRPTYLNKMYGESKFSSYASSLGEHQYFDKLFAFNFYLGYNKF